MTKGNDQMHQRELRPEDLQARGELLTGAYHKVVEL